MNSNEFVLKPSTEEVIDKADIQSGCGVIDCNYEFFLMKKWLLVGEINIIGTL